MSNCGNADKKTRYGVVTIRNPGRTSAPPNLTTFKRPEGDVVLQGPAIRSFKEAEVAATPRRLRKKGKVQAILLTGVGYRNYQLQASLYATDHQRYADPDCSLHCEGLAVDIHMGQSALRRFRIKRELIKRGWHYAVDGEPWHASFGFEG